MHCLERLLMLQLSFLLYILIVQSQWSYATDTLNQSQQLFVNQTLVSAKQIFEIGFFRPNNSSRVYLGMWYKNIPDRKILWVANREHPLAANDSAANLKIGPAGNLRIEDGKQKVVWSTNVAVQSNSTVAVLTDLGDFILQDIASGSAFWESFNCPTDTLLPGMMGLNSRTGEKRFMSSWKAEDDPAPGQFVTGPAAEQPTQSIVWKGSMIHWRSGPWNGWKFIGIAFDAKNYASGVYVFKDNQPGMSTVIFNTYDDSHPTILKLTPSGAIALVSWREQINQWTITWKIADSQCDHYGTCGPFGVCNQNKSPICQCLKGYKPRSHEEWSKGIWRSGCVPKTDLLCETNSSNLHTGRSENDGFQRLSVMKLPDLYVLIHEASNVKSCERECLRNCSCVAYAYPEGIGCMVWVGNLIDSQRLPFAGEDLFLRLAYPELVVTGSQGEENIKIKIIVSFTTILSIVVLAIFIYCFRRPKAMLKGRRKNRGKISALADEAAFLREVSQLLPSEDQRFTSIKLPIIDFAKIVASTDNFSEVNKLGEGGFGPVYKGTMETGQLIAVKRLSSVSGQGVEEFKNEIILISKLQHRNLVKLLGCCIHGEEKLLVYEYMKNKSLDTFLFDSTKKQLLDWTKRFHIIRGIAKGLLYLHRDSCLRVIHRDLKASNVLLDDHMNPKIADFGLARAFRVTQELVNTHRVVGTFGYMSPEYAIWGLFSEKSDVYSFGVLLLEIISGKKNSGFFMDDNYLSLLGLAWKKWVDQDGLELMDKSLEDSSSAVEVMRCIHIGLLCVQDHPADRPTIFDVIFMLNGDTDLPQPKQPTFTLHSWLESTGESFSNLCSTDTESTSLIENR